MPKSAAVRLHDDLQDLKTEIAEHLHDAAQKTGDEAAAALRRSSDAVSRAARRLGQDLRDQTLDSARHTAEVARTHPVTTVSLILLAASAIGLLLARDRFER